MTFLETMLIILPPLVGVYAFIYGVKVGQARAEEAYRQRAERSMARDYRRQTPLKGGEVFDVDKD